MHYTCKHASSCKAKRGEGELSDKACEVVEAAVGFYFWCVLASFTSRNVRGDAERSVDTA